MLALAGTLQAQDSAPSCHVGAPQLSHCDTGGEGKRLETHTAVSKHLRRSVHVLHFLAEPDDR